MTTVLFLAANPKGTEPLRLDEEIRDIKQALRTTKFRDLFDIEQEWAVRAGDLQGLLQQHRPDIVHFSGHGSPASGIFLEDEAGHATAVDPADLADLFQILKGSIRCVVLNACYTENQARAIGQHIDCVVGMSRAVKDQAAIQFATAFYQALGYDQDLKTAFNCGCNQITLMGLGAQCTPQLIASRVDPATVHLTPHPGGGPAAPGVVVGQPPPLAAAYQPRVDALARVEAAFTTPGPGGERAHTVLLGGDGGVGKTQLATGIFARAATTSPVRIWVPATTLDTLLTGYAAAGATVDAPGADDADLGVRAAGFLQWLAGPGATNPWLIVLDDLALTPTQMCAWWPPATPQGRTLVTTRRRDAAFDGHGRTRVPLTVYTPDEARSYLETRLTPHLTVDIPADALTHATELAADLGHLPVALTQAAAVIIDTSSTCAAYLQRFNNRATSLADLFPTWAAADSYTRTVATTWSLAIEAADKLPPVGLARPAAQLAAVLDPTGVPLELWATAPACAYLSDGAAGTPPVSAQDGQVAVLALAKLCIITFTPGEVPTGVRIHALAQRAIRDTLTLTPTHLAETIRAAADALVEVWPAVENDPNLTVVLRANVTHLDNLDPTALWKDKIHPVLLRVGHSLGKVGLVSEARDHYEQLTARATRELGANHHDTLITRHKRAYWQGRAGNPAGAANALANLLPEMQEVLGTEHPDTLTTRLDLASWRGKAGDPAAAVGALKNLFPDMEEHLGDTHPLTLATRKKLADWQGRAGDPAGAAVALEDLIPDMERERGPEHPDTLTTRYKHAYWQGRAGNPKGAAEALKDLLEVEQRVLGPHHPDTFTTRRDLAVWHGRAGDPADAATALKNLLPELQDVLGDNHPYTLTTRRDLAEWQGRDANPAAATKDLEDLLPNMKDVFGPYNPETLTTRRDLAYWRGRAGDPTAAAEALKNLLPDMEEHLGDTHPLTLTTRKKLADWQGRAGDPAGAANALEDLIPAMQEVLGAKHPDSLTTRYKHAYWQGRVGDPRGAAEALKDLLPVMQEVLGPDHPDTLTTRATLATLTSEPAEKRD